MKLSSDQHAATPGLATRKGLATREELVDAIAQSPIVVERALVALPEGFEAIDVAILNWIVAESRRLRGLALA